MFEEHFNNNKTYYLPNVILEYLEEKKFTQKELLVLEFIVKNHIRNQKLNHSLKEILKEFRKRVSTELEKRQKEEKKEISIDKEVDELDILSQESFDRYDLFLEYTK